MENRQRICFCVTNDLVTDQRVLRHARVAAALGMDVMVVGRQLPESALLNDYPFPAVRFRLPFRSGPLFYAAYNLRLFVFLLGVRCTHIVANDLDTLPAAYLAAGLRRLPLIFDSHEYFTGVPELMGRRLVRSIWKGFEKWLVPKVKYRVTVNDSIAALFEKEYGLKFEVVRNIGEQKTGVVHAGRNELGLPSDKKIIILQGSWINVDRGAEEAIEAVVRLEGALLLIIGGGDVFPLLRKRASEHDCAGKVKIMDKMPSERLRQYTAHADLGLTLDKDSNINYRFSLPNKLFDYISAGVPVLATPMVEVKNIVETYGVGEVTASLEPELLAEQIRNMLNDENKRHAWKSNLKKAASQLTWEQEKKKWEAVLNAAVKT